MTHKFFGAKLPIKISCEFFCYSIHNMASVLLLFSIIHQLEYYIMTFNSALVFSILTPVLVASSTYLIYLFKNDKIGGKLLTIFLALFVGVFIEMYSYTRAEIYNKDNYEVFFSNYFFYLVGLVFVWILLYLLEKLLIKFGSKKQES